MDLGRDILLVDGDTGCGAALAVVLRRQGNRVRLVHTRSQALQASRRRAYDVAIVDLFLGGGGTELARVLSRRVPHLVLSLGARLSRQELIEAALGFPVLYKAALPALLRGPDASSNGRAFGATRRGSRRPAPAASARAPRHPAPRRHRARPRPPTRKP